LRFAQNPQRRVHALLARFCYARLDYMYHMGFDRLGS
jgi:hypothetical protein